MASIQGSSRPGGRCLARWPGWVWLASPAGLPARRVRPRAAAALTNLQLAGQRVISSYPGLTPPQSLLNDITAGQTAGVIFFGENISSDDPDRRR